MSDSGTPTTKVKTEEPHQELPSTVPTPEHGNEIKREEAADKPNPEAPPSSEVENGENGYASPQPSAADVANPLFGRAGSVNIKEEENDEVQVLKAPARSRNQAGKPRSRKKVTASKFSEVMKHMQTRLVKDDGVLVDCTYFAQDGSATVNSTQRTLNVFGTLLLSVLIADRSMIKHTTGSIS